MDTSTVSSTLELTLHEVLYDNLIERSVESKKACLHCCGDFSWLA